jgi:hypothetical protein
MEMEKASMGCFDAKPSSTFQGAQPFQRTTPLWDNGFPSKDTHTHSLVTGLEDSTLPLQSCQSNHADSYGPTVTPRGDNALHHQNSTSDTKAVDSHNEAIVTTKELSNAMLPGPKEEDPSLSMAIPCETRAGDEPWTVRKRDSSMTNDADDIEGGPCSRTALPLGLRNKKMKPTDCLLFAATLLSKVDAAAVAVAPPSPRSTAVPKQPPTAMETASEASGDDRSQPRDVDVLCGRGGLINKHPGNVVYRKVVDYNKPYYQRVHKKHRILVSQSIVQSILNFGGRFLTLGTKNKTWMEIGYKRAVQKTSQALRERSAAQEEGDDDEDNDDDDDGEDADEDSRSYRKQKGYPNNQEDFDSTFRWDAQTNLKKNQEILKGS